MIDIHITKATLLYFKKKSGDAWYEYKEIAHVSYIMNVRSVNPNSTNKFQKRLFSIFCAHGFWFYKKTIQSFQLYNLCIFAAKKYHLKTKNSLYKQIFNVYSIQFSIAEQVQSMFGVVGE